jgi:hypothetical protein
VDDADKFQFTNLRPGKYKLFAWEDVDDDLWPDPEFRRIYDNRAQEVNVGPRETLTVQLRVIAADEIQVQSAYAFTAFETAPIPRAVTHPHTLPAAYRRVFSAFNPSAVSSDIFSSICPRRSISLCDRSFMPRRL